MVKTALILSEKKSFWKSCITITKNLLLAYQYSFAKNDLLLFNFDKDMEEKEVWQSAKDIFEAKPERIVFLDHNPHPWQLIHYLDKVYQGKLPPLIFHVYGDFVCLSHLYEKVRSILEKTPTVFFVASQKQKKLLAKLVGPSSSNLFIIPFPVDENHFKFDPQLRDQFRKDYQISEKEKVFLYTGRITFQKNVIPLIQIFSKLTKFNKDIRLLLAGEFTDMGVPFLGKYHNTGFTYYQWQRTLRLLDAEARSRIDYLGNLNDKDLLKSYCGSDLFISLSTFNDEDYGMSPAEALCCGLPSLLTEWGGYSDFLEIQKNSELRIPVEIKDSSVDIDQKVVMKKLLKQSTLPNPSPEERISLSHLAHNQLSISSVALQLKEYLEKMTLKNEVQFSEDFKILANSFKENNEAPFLSKAGGFNQLYLKLYSSYAN